MDECVFCQIARKKIPVNVIYESENFLAFPDKNPKVEGHTLIIPKKHFVNAVDMPADLGSELLDVVKRIFEIKSKEGSQGFNLVMNNGNVAGQIVMHAHLHFLPRKEGDKGFHTI